MTLAEAKELMKEVLDVLIHINHGATEEQVSEATQKLFRVHDKFLLKMEG